MSRLLTVIGVLFFVAASCSALFLSGYVLAENKTNMKWEKLRQKAEEAAKAKEEAWDLTVKESEERLKSREKAIEERRQKMDTAWKALMDALPDCELPPDIGMLLNTTIGVPQPAGTSGTPRSDPPVSP